jgi:hypothetical protein
VDAIEIELKRGIWTARPYQIRVRAHNDHVLMNVSGKIVKFRTPAAHKAGFKLAKKAGEATCGEFVIMNINGESLELEPQHALKVGGALLRKADDVDDYQQRKTK